MTTWYEQLGFRQNPLDLRPNPRLVGLEKQEEELKNHIRKGEICFIHGLTGSGKSSLLVRLQNELKDHSFVYLDAQELPVEFSLDEAIKNNRSILDKIALREYPSKPAVVVIDEFQATSPALALQARAKWENPNEKKVKSIVMAQISRQIKNVTPAFKERLGSRMITLPTLDDNEMKEILRIRLQSRNGTNYYNKLHNEAINLLVACADGNPRRLLEYADYLFDFHYRKFGEHNPLLSNKTYLVNYYGAKEILDYYGVNTNAYAYLSPEDREREIEEYQKKFSPEERLFLSEMMAAPKSVEMLAREFQVPKKEALAVLNSIKRKKGLDRAGKLRGQQLWQASQHVKRLNVNV